MKEIQLSQGQVALVDDEDFEYLNQFKWQYKDGYAKRDFSRTIGRRGKMCMHRFIMNTPDGMETDHINGNRLDNRKENLRICTHSQNVKNVKVARKNNTSGYKGVYKHTQSKRWVARISVDGNMMHLGVFDDVKEAAHAYDNAAMSFFGEFAVLNFPIAGIDRDDVIDRQIDMTTIIVDAPIDSSNVVYFDYETHIKAIRGSN